MIYKILPSLLILTVFLILPIIFFAIDQLKYANSLERWRRVQRYGVKAKDHPLLALVFDVVEEPQQPVPPGRIDFVVVLFYGVVFALMFLCMAW